MITSMANIFNKTALTTRAALILVWRSGQEANTNFELYEFQVVLRFHIV